MIFSPGQMNESALAAPDDDGIRDIALDELEAASLLGVGLDGGEVGSVAGVGELVEDRDPGAVSPPEHVTDEGAPDETGTTGDKQASIGGEACLSPVGEALVPRGAIRHRQPTGRSTGRPSRPASSSSRASSAARISDGTVPASVHWPSYTRWNSRPSGM